MGRELELLYSGDGERVDQFVVRQIDGTSRAEVQRWVRDGDVTVNGQTTKTGHRLVAGDVVRVVFPDEQLVSIELHDLPLSVVYEDQDCVVVDKPPGLVVHPATSHRQDTLVNALLYRYPEITSMVDPGTENGLRPGIVHRLDKDTSGLIVVARHDQARNALQRQFRAREVEKGYLALLHGQLFPIEGRIAAPIGRDPRARQRMAVVPDGREAITEYVTQRYLATPHSPKEFYTLVDIRPLTGRTHQIRVHFAHSGHPVAGDKVYGRRKKRIACPRQFLHACRLGFHRPGDGEWLLFDSPLPQDLQGVLSQLQTVD